MAIRHLILAALAASTFALAAVPASAQTTQACPKSWDACTVPERMQIAKAVCGAEGFEEKDVKEMGLAKASRSDFLEKTCGVKVKDAKVEKDEDRPPPPKRVVARDEDRDDEPPVLDRTNVRSGAYRHADQRTGRHRRGPNCRLWPGTTLQNGRCEITHTGRDAVTRRYDRPNVRCVPGEPIEVQVKLPRGGIRTLRGHCRLSSEMR